MGISTADAQPETNTAYLDIREFYRAQRAEAELRRYAEIQDLPPTDLWKVSARIFSARIGSALVADGYRVFVDRGQSNLV